MEFETRNAFAVWITGLPASGKSTVAASLKSGLAHKGIDVAVLESDVLRRVLSPQARFDEQGRETFYRQMVYIGTLLTEHGVSVVFDATANRRRYRDYARRQIPQFVEVYVSCPLEVCMARDPKGIYRKGRSGAAHDVPGFQAIYEPPETPDVLVHGDREASGPAAQRIIDKLVEKGYL